MQTVAPLASAAGPDAPPPEERVALRIDSPPLPKRERVGVRALASLTETPSPDARAIRSSPYSGPSVAPHPYPLPLR